MFDKRDRLIRRLNILEIANGDIEAQRAFTAKSSRDIVWWVNTFCCTYDPRLESPTVPFFLFPKQAEALHFFQDLYTNKRRGLVDKSRDVGITWLVCTFLVHQWLFSPGFKGSVGSRKASLVDQSGDPDCIFEKMRFLIGHLPLWMQPLDWQKYGRNMLISNHDNEAVITGEAGDQIGRGGRSGMYFLDEAAFIERSKKVIAALSQNTDCLIQVSTPNGTTNEFYRAISSGRYPRISLHWKDDPRKNQWVTEDGTTGNGWDAPENARYPWYDRQCLDLDSVTIAQELDLDYTASVEGIFIPSAWVKHCIDSHYKIPAIAESDTINAGLDVSAGGSNQTVLVLRRNGYVLPNIERWSGMDTTQATFKTDSILREKGVFSLCFDADGVGAGVAGTLASIANKPYMVTSFKGASTEGMDSTYWGGEKKTSKEKFQNRRAEAWGIVRERVKNTFEHLTGIKTHDPRDMISIPNDPELILQLSQPTIKYNASGKILLSPKSELNRSPDTADAVVYAFVRPNGFAWWDE